MKTSRVQLHSLAAGPTPPPRKKKKRKKMSHLLGLTTQTLSSPIPLLSGIGLALSGNPDPHAFQFLRLPTVSTRACGGCGFERTS